MDIKAKDSVWEFSANSYVDFKPKYKNLREEVLNNKYSSISKRCWNNVLRECQAIYQVGYIVYILYGLIYRLTHSSALPQLATK